MFIRVKTEIVLKVNDKDEAEEACHHLGSLDRVLISNSFPHEVIETDVDHYEEISAADATELGYEEE